MRYIIKTFQKFYFDSLYDAETWWKLSAAGTDQLKNLQGDIIKRVQVSMNKVYNKEVVSQQSALALLIIAVLVVFAHPLSVARAADGGNFIF